MVLIGFKKGQILNLMGIYLLAEGRIQGFFPRGLKSFSFQKWWGPETPSLLLQRRAQPPPPPPVNASAHTGLPTNWKRLNWRQRFGIFLHFWFIPTI